MPKNIKQVLGVYCLSNILSQIDGKIKYDPSTLSKFYPPLKIMTCL